MRIREIKAQHRRDIWAIFECEHCGCIIYKHGYDDYYFHNNVIPNMICKKCGKTADSDYQSKQTKYPEGFQV